MDTRDHNPERVAVPEIRRLRDGIRAMVTLRMSGVPTQPLDEVRVPEFVRRIVQQLLDDYRARYPAGLPPPPDGHRIVAEYGERAVRAYDAEISQQFELTHV